ncbi:MAG: hypothetical protein GVY05_09205 [Bacteroidetes bacterium]|jgi:hypothetical protein|nr:hypothetical protein [Bacteroidota bacterium]
MTKSSVDTDQKQLKIVEINKEKYLKISDSSNLRPFFMSIVSPSNHWMFMSSNGGITAGRKNASYALFPYYTDDKITEFADITGSKTILKVFRDNQPHFWEPFSKRFVDGYNITRNLYKNIYGNKVLFEEINHDLECSFSYQWSCADDFGFIKKSKLKNLSTSTIKIECLDGLQNILPAKVDPDLQVASSNLVDAYKRSELDETSGMGIFALSAIPVDKAEPSEALKANVVWSLGLKNPNYLLSSLQLEDFRQNNPIQQEVDIKAERGAYFAHQNLSLSANSSENWSIVADVNYNHAQVIKLRQQILNSKNLNSEVNENINLCTENLIKLAASADGLQYSSDELRDIRHYSNTMFNIMRGGIFDNNYHIDSSDFKEYIKNANKKVFSKFSTKIDNLGQNFTLDNLKSLIRNETDPDFTRLTIEYLPLKFSRRHGDPSRPWNQFSINLKDEDGSKVLDYEGNWRDIFQNWESLAYSYPAFIDGMIFKFLNATTFDGYNPYRLTKDGFDWEVIEPDDPWSYIGYWGDHQIIYLLKFLEFLNNYNPDKLISFFSKNYFVYANVPYRIKAYKDIVQDPKDTIEFDLEEDRKIRNLRKEIGGDGALLKDSSNQIIHVNFIEKILATTLAKLSNFIPEAGIWMNTQRPEWNDANNALVGNGVSMVTLYYLRRFLSFFQTRFKDLDDAQSFELSEEVCQMFNQINSVFESHKALLNKSITDSDRKDIVDKLGKSASEFRMKIYNNKFSGHKQSLTAKTLKTFVDDSLEYLEHSISNNKRNDNLYHAYNLLTIEDDSFSISYLEEMLEGQVAVLSSKYLTSKQAVSVLDALKHSALFREDQYSYLLYPNKDLKGFLDRNQIPEASVNSSELLQKLVKDKHVGIIQKDVLGNYHFNGNFNNVSFLKTALKELENTEYAALVSKDFERVCQIFEEVFNHKAFTGRSGTFYGYEGLGSIYWHMVSKLQLAVLECCNKAIAEKEPAETVGRLLEHYYEINEGIGVHKSPKLYGAFPTDPYSHTPYGKGAQQPGMTGQVKEDIISRFGELGICFEEAELKFKPDLLLKEHFLTQDKEIKYITVNREVKPLTLKTNQLFFTICQVPVIYEKSNKNKTIIEFNDGLEKTIETLELPKDISNDIFKRTNQVKLIQVQIDNSILK